MAEKWVRDLQTFTVTLGGVKFNAVDNIQELWGQFELGLSRNEFVETLTKIYPSHQAGDEYFTAADALLAGISLRRIIRSEQRRVAGVRSQWDTIYWVLTDEGRKLVLFLKEGNYHGI